MFWTQYQLLCQRVGKSPNGVAKEIGLSSGTVTFWKNGKIPKSDTLKKIADYFGVTVDELLGNDTPAPAPASPVITFTPEEQRVILRYRAMSEEAKLIIRKILDIPNGDEELVPVYHAAHSKDGTAEDRIIYRTRAELDALENAPESDVDI
jgi:transcriptional regulator with XRE-family HTH domain